MDNRKNYYCDYSFCGCIQIYYSDSIRTIDNYNFSTGTKSGDTITIPGGFVTKPEAENGLSYTFGLFGTGYTLSWTAPNPSTIQVSGDTDGAIVIGTTPALPDESTAQTAWNYHVKLQHFTATSTTTDGVTYYAGMGSDETTNQPVIEVTWLVNGHLQLTARVGDYDAPVWQLTPIDLGVQPPVTTVLDLRLQNTGTAISFYYTLNSGTETLIDTFESGDGYVAANYVGFPVLFPFVNLETDSSNPGIDPFIAFSFHENNSAGNKYYAGIFVSDPDQTTYESISAVSSGTPCGDNLPSTALTYNGAGQWWISPGVFLSENTPPGCFPSYTFTAVRKAGAGGGTVTETRTITGYVQEFATNLLPTGTVTGTPTFSWTGIAGATGYSVQVSDNLILHQIWGIVLDGPQTSIVYSGPALVPGQTYYYYVNSNISTTGVSNQSIVEGSFTYSPPASSSLYATFPGGGVYQYNGTTWSQVTPNSPEDMVVSGSNFYGDFGLPVSGCTTAPPGVRQPPAIRR